MIILGIETSCDETAAAILEKPEDSERIQILSNVISTSLELHAKFGGVIPEQAAREQLKLIVPVIDETLDKAFPGHQPFTINNPPPIDAIAVTYGPGLIGSLLVGVETAKVLSEVWNKPLIPVNHLLGHLYANWITNSNAALKPNGSLAQSLNSSPTFPCIGLLVSGGHTDLVLFKNHMEYEYLGGTRDDAAGECFDKCARVLGFSYPGGPKISKLASLASGRVTLPQPMLDSGDLDFSFSGLKTAFVNYVDEHFKLDRGYFDKEKQTWIQKSVEEQLSAEKLQEVYNLCASLEETIVNVLVKKTIRACQTNRIEQVIVAGGVAANKKLKEQLIAKFQGSVLIPEPILCTDNAAMIASAAFFTKQKQTLNIQATPNLSLDN